MNHVHYWRHSMVFSYTIKHILDLECQWAVFAIVFAGMITKKICGFKILVTQLKSL